VAEGGGDVPDTAQPEGAYGEVAPGRHGPGSVPGPQLRGVFGEGGVADVVQGLDLPVVPDQLRELGRGGLLGGQAGDRIDGGDGDLPVLRLVRRRLIWTNWRAPGKSRLLTMATLIRRISERPWPLSRVRL